jgi:long-chain acyl-CoA synthetase
MTTGRAEIGWIPQDLNPNGFKSIPELLEHCTKEFGSKPAFTSLGQTITYNELAEHASAFAHFLQTETDLEPGDRIAIQLPNLIQYPIVLFGSILAGMIVVNTNPLYTAHEMEYQFKDSGAKALIIYQCMAPNAEKILANTDIEKVILVQAADLHGLLKRTLIHAVIKHVKKMQPDFNLPQALSLRKILNKHKGKKHTPVEVSPASTAALQYTGGTTGFSKGAELTHANILSNILQTSPRIRTAGKDWAETAIKPLPLYHIYAFTLAQTAMLSGGHCILIPNPRDIPGFVKELKKWQITAFVGLNTLFVALCREPGFDSLDFSKFRITSSGGMALTHDAAEQWEKITGCTITEGYGLTETSPMVTINPPGAQQIGTIGLPLPHTKVLVIDNAGNDLGEGKDGELCVWGPQVMAGYWKKDAETEASFTDDGYFKTGDIAVLHSDGFISIADRAKDIIIVSGFNVYPNEVEEVASHHPDIVECAAIGIPDDVTGESVKLFVVTTNENLTLEDIRSYCRDKLTGYKIPRSIQLAEELPKTNVGKILRRSLRDGSCC